MKSKDKRIIAKSEAQEVIDLAYGSKKYKVLKLTRIPDKRAIRVEVQCCRCGSIEEYVYGYFRKGEVKCPCGDSEGLKKMAKNYAKALYIEPEMGLIVGDELYEYITSSLGYDMPGLKDCIEFVEYVEEYMLDIYETKKATQCKRCKGYYPAKYISLGKICYTCRNGV